MLGECGDVEDLLEEIVEHGSEANQLHQGYICPEAASSCG